MCTYVMSAAESIESNALRLRAQRLSAELSAGANLRTFCNFNL